MAQGQSDDFGEFPQTQTSENLHILKYASQICFKGQIIIKRQVQMRVRIVSNADF